MSNNLSEDGIEVEEKAIPSSQQMPLPPAEYRFYHLMRRTPDDALIILLKQCLSRQWRAVVKVSSDERAETLSGYIWSHSGQDFMAHGTIKDGFSEDQPIWITSKNENPNDSSVLFLLDEAEEAAEENEEKRTATQLDFSMICYIFDGRNIEITDNARDRWKKMSDEPYQKVYMKQAADGNWQRK